MNTATYIPKKEMDVKKLIILFLIIGILLFFFFFTCDSEKDVQANDKTFSLFFLSEKGRELKYDYEFSIKRISELRGQKTESNSQTRAVINYTFEDTNDMGNLFVSLSFENQSHLLMWIDLIKLNFLRCTYSGFCFFPFF